MIEQPGEYSKMDSALDLVEFVLELRPLYLKLPFFKNIKQMTYEKAIAFLTENEPPVPFEKAALILERQNEEQNMFFVQIFLDEEDRPVSDPATGKPYGRRCLIRGMDDELVKIFGNKQVVIVK
jgi:hypothetical protein